MSVLYTNVDQFVNKRDVFCVMIAGDEPDLILLTEVIPQAQVMPISPALLSLPGYIMYTHFDPSSSDRELAALKGLPSTRL